MGDLKPICENDLSIVFLVIRTNIFRSVVDNLTHTVAEVPEISTLHSSDAALPTAARRAKRENGGLGENPPGSPMMTHHSSKRVKIIIRR